MADIKETFSKGITALNMKTSTFLETRKIETYIATLKGEIEALEKEIGHLVYERWEEEGEISPSSFEAQLEEIRQKKRLIEEQTRAARELEQREKDVLGKEGDRQGRLYCPNCGQAYDQPVNFCRKCGTKLR